MRRIGRWASIIGGILFLTATLFFLWLRTSLPQLDGQVSVPEIQSPTSIARDARGIVVIAAKRWSDAYMALGFAHAQDRITQMEMMRRLGNGRLSELLGERGLGADRFARLIGFRRLAEKQWANASPALREILQSYAKGVNAYLSQRRGALPPDLLILDPLMDIEEWHPIDSLLWGRIMALRLSSNRYEEALNARMQRLLPKEFFETIAAVPPRGASNNWVLSPAMSLSGKPLLANDPHLELTAPSQWYLAKLVVGKEWRAGATAPGLPFIVIGTNQDVAWGFTTTTSDTQDLFVEIAASAAQYLTPVGLKPFERWQEIIKVKKEPHEFTFRRTRHGPVLSDVTDPDGPVMALSWAGFHDDDRTAEAFMNMNQAHDSASFYQALRDFHTPQQNIVYADRAGNIGFIAAGRVPIRKKVTQGSLLPVPGDKGDNDWIGWVPFDALPQGQKAPYFATANHDITPANYPYFLAGKWESPYRINRITELLREKPPFSLSDMAAMQLDILSPAARRLGPSLHAVAQGDIKQLLGEWDYRMDKDGPQGAIFTLWLSHWSRTLTTQALGVEYDRWFFWQIDDLLRIEAQCHCPERREIALTSAIEELSTRLGKNPREWKWGDIHRVAFRHPIWQSIPLLGPWLDADLPASGDNFTLNRASPDPKSHDDIHGPGLRFIIDMAHPEDAQFSVAGGQSGNILSPHYADILPEWNEGRYVTMTEQAEHHLTLEPKP